MTHREVLSHGQDDTPVISVRDVHKSYHIGEVLTPVLSGVDLEIRRGDFVVIFGVSGSGKTTLLNLIGAIDSVDQGSVRLDGLELAGASRSTLIDARRVKIGYVFQFYNLIPTLTAIENVEMALELLGLERSELERRSANYLERVGMLDLARKYPDQLSGGEQQRVAIARAIVSDPAILVADEPTGDLDRKSAGDILDLMDRLNTEIGKTIIMVTHDPHAAERAHLIKHLEKGVFNS